MATYRSVSNPEYAAAMRGLRRSSAAAPQERRNKRLRTKQTVIRNEMRNS